MDELVQPPLEAQASGSQAWAAPGPSVGPQRVACPPVLIQHRFLLQVVHVVLVFTPLLPQLVLQPCEFLRELLFLQPELLQGCQLPTCPTRPGEGPPGEGRARGSEGLEQSPSLPTSSCPPYGS